MLSLGRLKAGERTWTYAGAGEGMLIVGRDGQTLRDKWKQTGVKTFLGLHTQGFPNLFIMSGPQSGGAQFNFTRGLEGHTDYVVWMLKTLQASNAGIVDITRESEIAYAQHCAEADLRTRPLRDCLSYYNGDGEAEPGSLAYYGGPQKRHEYRSAAQETLSPYVFEAASG